MALYTDPQTGQRREVDDLSRPRASSSLGIVALLIVLALISWYFFGRVSPTVNTTNTGASTVTAPVTSPPTPNASPARPAPSPNPGP
ncbi:histone deacetylase [Hyphomicrobium sp.]|uniref:histone deacetylase n=1 Tax=Hyphomicrobium sp. TaxID=82 RepID=UPI001DE44046|nr:histone deacetylase [Hyphomicrobium sp.]MBY0561218.1 histone deacetylase [Hyphomicrobium sp.]